VVKDGVVDKGAERISMGFDRGMRKKRRIKKKGRKKEKKISLAGNRTRGGRVRADRVTYYTTRDFQLISQNSHIIDTSFIFPVHFSSVCAFFPHPFLHSCLCNSFILNLFSFRDILFHHPCHLSQHLPRPRKVFLAISYSSLTFSFRKGKERLFCRCYQRCFSSFFLTQKLCSRDLFRIWKASSFGENQAFSDTQFSIPVSKPFEECLVSKTLYFLESGSRFMLIYIALLLGMRESIKNNIADCISKIKKEEREGIK
jgi:hypothetical protein